MKIIGKLFIGTLGAVLVLGCAFVQPTADSKKVRVLAAHEVERCRSLGTITSTVSDRVGVVLRRRAAVDEDVLQNARNAAAEMGGDTVVPLETTEIGKQAFNVYTCLTP